MKQQIILWISSIVLTFLTGYFYSVTRDDFPVTGTIGIEGKKVSYYLPKVYYGKDTMKIVLRSDYPIAKTDAVIEYKVNGIERGSRKGIGEGNTITFIVDSLKSNDIVLHKIKLYFSKTSRDRNDEKISEKDKELNLNPEMLRAIELIEGRWQETRFYNTIPKSLRITSFLTFYLGLLLAIRGFFEIFANYKDKIKVYTIFIFIMFILNRIVLESVIISVKNNAIGTKVLPLSLIFPSVNLMLPFIWLIGFILIFNFKQYRKQNIAVLSVITVIYMLIYL